MHLLFPQTLFFGHSILKTHSGRHPLYGSPKYSGRHVHLFSKQIAFGPQLQLGVISIIGSKNTISL